MESTFDNYGNAPESKIPLPSASSVYTLGIISIVGIFCCSLAGIICGIIGLVNANKDLKLYASDPEKYTPESLGKLNSGRTCSIIGLSISCLMMIGAIIYYIVVGSAVFYSRLHGNNF